MIAGYLYVSAAPHSNRVQRGVELDWHTHDTSKRPGCCAQMVGSMLLDEPLQFFSKSRNPTALYLPPNICLCLLIVILELPRDTPPLIRLVALGRRWDRGPPSPKHYNPRNPSFRLRNPLHDRLPGSSPSLFYHTRHIVSSRQ